MVEEDFLKCARHHFATLQRRRRTAVVVAAAAVGTFSMMAGSTGRGSIAAQAGMPVRPAVLVELFTSEGCSSCPPADTLLRQINGQTGRNGQLIIGVSEHVTYWDGIGWKDPFSSGVFTERQAAYGRRFRLPTVYTPQMVVDGRTQLVGSDRNSLVAAIAAETGRSHIDLHIDSAQIASDRLQFRYSATRLPSVDSLQLFAVFADDLDRSEVASGENTGRVLLHASVARLFVPLGRLLPNARRAVDLPLPSSLHALPLTGHHLIVFAQEAGGGAVLGVDSRPI